MGSSNRKKKEKKKDFQVCFAKFLLQNWPKSPYLTPPSS